MDVDVMRKRTTWSSGEVPIADGSVALRAAFGFNHEIPPFAVPLDAAHGGTAIKSALSFRFRHRPPAPSHGRDGPSIGQPRG